MNTNLNPAINIATYFHASLGILLVACLLFLSQPAHAGVAGHVQFVNGLVQVTNAAGQVHLLQKGDAIHESDMVTTNKNSSAQIKMRDGGLIAVRPDSQLKFDSFVFMGAQDGKEKSFFSLLKGGFRAITGLIGQKNKDNYRIKTLASTIGIRGTDHEVFVVVPGSELAATTPAGTYNKVNMGETVITTDKGTVNILPNQMGFAAAADQMPLLQPINLNLFTAVPVPTPQAKLGSAATERNDIGMGNLLQEQNTAPENAMPKDAPLKPIVIDRPSAPPIIF